VKPTAVASARSGRRAAAPRGTSCRRASPGCHPRQGPGSRSSSLVTTPTTPRNPRPSRPRTPARRPSALAGVHHHRDAPGAPLSRALGLAAGRGPITGSCRIVSPQPGQNPEDRPSADEAALLLADATGLAPAPATGRRGECAGRRRRRRDHRTAPHRVRQILLGGPGDQPGPAGSVRGQVQQMSRHPLPTLEKGRPAWLVCETASSAAGAHEGGRRRGGRPPPRVSAFRVVEGRSVPDRPSRSRRHHLSSGRLRTAEQSSG